MLRKLGTIKYVFVHLDGVLLENILGEIVKGMVERWGGKYNAEAENNVFAQPQEHATSFFTRKFNLSLSHEEVLNVYYEERAKVERKIKIKKQKGFLKFLQLMHSLELKVVAYGGAPLEYFTKHTGKYLHFFSDVKYIRTHKMRPGIKEIAKGVYNLKYNQVLFIDEENTVALAARKYKVPFIGMPSFKKGFQKEEMKKTNVKYLVRSLNEIDLTLLRKIDRDARENAVWK